MPHRQSPWIGFNINFRLPCVSHQLTGTSMMINYVSGKRVPLPVCIKSATTVIGICIFLKLTAISRIPVIHVFTRDAPDTDLDIRWIYNSIFEFL
jgi:hypothetical protein